MAPLRFNAAILIVSTILAGCSTTPSPPTASVSPNGGSPAIDRSRSDGTSFDPCTAFATSDLTKWGVNPTPSGHADTPDQPARGCQWDAPSWDLNVLVANQTFADYIRNQGARELEVAGRAGAISTDGPDTCYVSVPSQKAAVSVGVTLMTHTASIDPCAKATAIAPDVVRYLPPPG